MRSATSMVKTRYSHNHKRKGNYLLLKYTYFSSNAIIHHEIMYETGFKYEAIRIANLFNSFFSVLTDIY